MTGSARLPATAAQVARVTTSQPGTLATLSAEMGGKLRQRCAAVLAGRAPRC